MSNDLISRESLIENLNNGIQGTARDYLKYFAMAIQDEPTAYDKEAVMKKLQAEEQRWRESGALFNDIGEKSVAGGLRIAIAIVWKGGRE